MMNNAGIVPTVLPMHMACRSLGKDGKCREGLFAHSLGLYAYQHRGKHAAWRPPCNRDEQTQTRRPIYARLDVRPEECFQRTANGMSHAPENKKPLYLIELQGLFYVWRRDRDSNPRYPRRYNGFRIRPIRPLWHLSNGAHHNSTFTGSEAP